MTTQRRSLAARTAALLLSAAFFSQPAAAQTASLLHASTASLANNLLVEANPQHVLSAFGCAAIAGGTAGTCIAFNAATVPGSGSLTGAQVLDACEFNSVVGCTFSRIPQGTEYSQGIVILLSSALTPYTYTTGTITGFLWADYN